MIHYLESLIGTLSSKKKEPSTELPYEPIEWIGLSGGAYIQTPLYMSQDATITVKQRILTTSDSKAVFGYNKSQYYLVIQTVYRDNQHFYFLNSSYNSSLRYSANPTEVCTLEYTIDNTNSRVILTIDGEEKSYSMSYTSDSTPFALGANQGSSEVYVPNLFANNYIVYSSQAENSTGLLLDYIPCKLKSTGEYGCWDTVSDSFIGVSGNGTIFVP